MLSPKLHIALALLAVWVSHGCAGQIAIPSETDVPKRVVFEHFSLIPPLGEGWVREKKPNEIIYRKTLSMTHTVGAYVAVSQASIPRPSPPDTSDPKLFGQWAAQVATRHIALLDALVKRKEQQHATGRFRPINFVSELADTGEDKNATCQVFDATSEDHGVPGWEGRVFLLTEHGLICLCLTTPCLTTPDRGDWVLHGSYSERWLKGEKPSTSFQEDAKAFIRSVRFDGKLAPEKPY